MKPFRVSADYIDWAHGPGAESEGEGYDLAREICALPIVMPGSYVLVPAHRVDMVREIEDVAGLYVGGDDNDLRAASVRSRARKWLKEVA